MFKLKCLFKGHDEFEIKNVFFKGKDIISLFYNTKFMASGSLNIWSTEYESKPWFHIKICRRCKKLLAHSEFPDVRTK